ncbi:MAG TPA: TIGR00701 family protein [Glaciecola sp.]|jgi:putative membrane protein|nr:TIGR00701 family protein [Glaciecola sp.]HAQ48358.1 TIGR00701 family protein [Glaciecola sp.]HCF78654.1 TIGR00701 family protein [Glaciecola sp.]
MTLLWVKALHIFFMVAWMAGIFYLPRLFVYFAENEDPNLRKVFNVMQRRLWFFVAPFALLTLIFGVWLIGIYGMDWFRASTWLHVKLALLVGLYAYYGYLYKIMRDLANGRNIRSSKFYRILNEAPVLVLLAIVILAIVKPF